MSKIKGKGGLGFKDLQDFNIAMSAKQLWRIITMPNLMMRKVLRGKYCKGESIWTMKQKNGDSWMWRSIISARDLLEREARKKRRRWSEY